MTNPKTIIVDGLTGEEIERPMTNAEFAQWQADQAANQAREQEETQKAIEKAAVLTKLGLTEAEAKLLLS